MSAQLWDLVPGMESNRLCARLFQLSTHCILPCKSESCGKCWHFVKGVQLAWQSCCAVICCWRHLDQSVAWLGIGRSWILPCTISPLARRAFSCTLFASIHSWDGKTAQQEPVSTSKTLTLCGGKQELKQGGGAMKHGGSSLRETDTGAMNSLDLVAGIHMHRSQSLVSTNWAMASLISTWQWQPEKAPRREATASLTKRSSMVWSVRALRTLQAWHCDCEKSCCWCGWPWRSGVAPERVWQFWHVRLWPFLWRSRAWCDNWQRQALNLRHVFLVEVFTLAIEALRPAVIATQERVRVDEPPACGSGMKRIRRVNGSRQRSASDGVGLTCIVLLLHGDIVHTGVGVISLRWSWMMDQQKTLGTDKICTLNWCKWIMEKNEIGSLSRCPAKGEEWGEGDYVAGASHLLVPAQVAPHLRKNTTLSLWSAGAKFVN